MYQFLVLIMIMKYIYDINWNKHDTEYSIFEYLLSTTIRCQGNSIGGSRHCSYLSIRSISSLFNRFEMKYVLCHVLTYFCGTSSGVNSSTVAVGSRDRWGVKETADLQYIITEQKATGDNRREKWAVKMINRTELEFM